MFIRVLPLVLIICGLTGQSFSQPAAKRLSVGLSAPGDLLITKTNGKRIGSETGPTRNINEIEGAEIGRSSSGQPLYRVPVDADEKKLTIRITGTTAGTKGNLSITGDGFVTRLPDLELEPAKILTVAIAPDGQWLEISSTRAEELLKFNFAVDPPDAKQPSYLFKIERTKLPAQKKITLTLSIARGTLEFFDDSPAGTYSLNLIRIDPDGSEKKFVQSGIAARKGNKYQLDFKQWDGICLRTAGARKGFGNIKCRRLNSQN